VVVTVFSYGRRDFGALGSVSGRNRAFVARRGRRLTRPPGDGSVNRTGLALECPSAPAAS